MRNRSLLLLGFMGLVPTAFAQNHGLVNQIRAVVIASGANADPGSDVTHSGSGTVGPLSTSTSAAYTYTNVGGAASGTVTSDYGSLSYSGMAQSNMTPQQDAEAYMGGLGGYTGEDYDKLVVTGTPGGTGTFQVQLQLVGMDIQSASYVVNSGGDYTGLLGYCHVVTGDGATNTMLTVQDYLDTPSSSVSSLSATMTFSAVVGQTVYIDHGLRASVNAIPHWDGVSTRSASASVTGTSLWTINSETDGISVVSESGHDYSAVPEPSSIVALSIGAVAFLRRRSKRG